MKISIDGTIVQLADSMSVAAAIALYGDGITRVSVSGKNRSPVCGMGICQECRVIIDGQRRLACQTPCHEGMKVSTKEGM